MIVTPNVIRETRDYFNCSILEGAELEDQGGEGTALTHWEKRVFEVIIRCKMERSRPPGNFHLRFCLERGNDWHPHPEPNYFENNARLNGGYGLVHCELFNGRGNVLGERSRLRFCHEKLQGMDHDEVHKVSRLHLCSLMCHFGVNS